MKNKVTNENEINNSTEKIIGAAYSVANTLGFGFLEKVYENALIIELKKSGLAVEQQKPLDVYYDSQLVGQYFADLLVENEILVELKTVKTIDSSHQAQLMNYLKASKRRFGLIINFAKPKIEVKRMINGY